MLLPAENDRLTTDSPASTGTRFPVQNDRFTRPIHPIGERPPSRSSATSAVAPPGEGSTDSTSDSRAIHSALESLAFGPGFGALEALRSAGLRARLDDADRLRVGPPERIDDRIRALVQRHRDALVAVLAAERTWAAAGWDETTAAVLWTRVTRWYGHMGAAGGAWVETCCARLEAAERGRDAAGFWYAAQVFVREAARRQDRSLAAAGLGDANAHRAVA